MRIETTFERGKRLQKRYNEGESIREIGQCERMTYTQVRYALKIVGTIFRPMNNPPRADKPELSPSEKGKGELSKGNSPMAT